MRGMIRVAWAFLQRDLLLVKPWSWVMEWLESSVWVIFWYFASQLIGADQRFLSGGPVDYFTFSLIGLGLSQYVWRGFSSFADRVLAEQSSGGLEPLWVTAYPLPVLILLSNLWNFLAATVNAFIVLGVGVTLFGAQLTFSGILLILGVGLLTSLSMGSLGLLASSWVIASGRWFSLRRLLNGGIPILSGAFFPVSLFPAWLQAIAWCFPLTHALALARGILLPSMDTPTIQLWASLGLTTLCFTVTGWWSLPLALHQARVNGRIVAA